MVAVHRIERPEDDEELPGRAHVGDERVAPRVVPGVNPAIRVLAAEVREVDLIEDVEGDCLRSGVGDQVFDDQEWLPGNGGIPAAQVEIERLAGMLDISSGEDSRAARVALEPSLGAEGVRLAIGDAAGLVAKEAGAVDEMVHAAGLGRTAHLAAHA